MSTRKTLEAKVASIDGRIAQLLAQKEQELAKLDVEAEKAQRLIESIVGRVVLEQIPGGWRRVDLRRLASVMGSSSEVVGRCVAEELTVSETSRRAREFEREHRRARAERTQS